MLPYDIFSSPVTHIQLLIGHNYDEYSTGMLPYLVNAYILHGDLE